MNGVIFDFNGTLFLDNDKHIKAWSAISEILRGRPITEQELHEHMNGKPNHMIIRYMNGGKEDAALENKYSLKKEELYRQYCKEDAVNFHLIAGANTLFDNLKEAGIPFTIASASIKPNIDFFVESFGLDNWIKPEDIVYDDGTLPDKTAMFYKAADILGLPVEKLTVIEDSMAGVNSSLNAGIQDIRIINSGNIADQVKDLPQVKQILNDMTGIVRP